jgi:hypothetical protein
MDATTMRSYDDKISMVSLNADEQAIRRSINAT